MFEIYRETQGGEVQTGDDDADTTTGTELVAADGSEPPVARWRWQLTIGDKVIARSEESWAKRSAAIAAVAKVKSLVASAFVIEKLA